MPLKFPLTNLKIPLPTPPRLLKNLPLMPSDKNADLTSSCLTYSTHAFLGTFLLPEHLGKKFDIGNGCNFGELLNLKLVAIWMVLLHQTECVHVLSRADKQSNII